MPPTVSVLTLVHQRPRHLANLILGLNQSTLLPDELVVVHMNEPTAYPLPEAPYPIRRITLQSSNTKIPLARARNEAVAQSQGNRLVFLDVDCLPDTAMLAQYAQASQAFSGLLMGDVRYLPPHATDSTWTYAQLRSQAVAHPRRPVVTQLVQPERHELFWTLTFTLDRATYERLGGLDEQFQGYGGEDTDLAFTARQRGIPFALCPAQCFHQHHPVYRPPLQHFDDIVANARYFYQKWQQWPMEGWLSAFRELGLIRWDSEATGLEVIRHPTEAQRQAAYHEAPAGF